MKSGTQAMEGMARSACRVGSRSRRAALLAWARRHDAVILEDDYDAEYRYDRAAVGALQGLEPDQIVYAGSVSKTLAPALRLGREDVAHPGAGLERGHGS